jgi:tetratricopeptide (TPR) repeat protein
LNDIKASPILIRYQKILEKNPDSRVFAPLAQAYRKLGMLDKALEILHIGIREHPKYALGHLGLAQCYADLDKYQHVYEVLKEFAQQDRNNLKLQNLFAESCIKIGKEDYALETLKYLLFINPKDRKVAALVSKLEQTNDHKVGIETEQMPSTVFEINQILSNPDDYDYDDWRQEDFAFTKKVDEIDDQNWAMSEEVTDLIKNVDQQLDEKEREYVIDTSKLGQELAELEKRPLQNEVSGAVITHTLVDLYCAQGHLEKAIEILQKILLLNPDDLNTQKKLKEIEQLVLSGTPIFDDEEGYSRENEQFKKDEIIEEIHNSEFLQSLGINDSIAANHLKSVDKENNNNVEKNNLMNYFDNKSNVVAPELATDLKHTKVLKLQTLLTRIKEMADRKTQLSSATTL